MIDESAGSFGITAVTVHRNEADTKGIRRLLLWDFDLGRPPGAGSCDRKLIAHLRTSQTSALSQFLPLDFQPSARACSAGGSNCPTPCPASTWVQAASWWWTRTARLASPLSRRSASRMVAGPNAPWSPLPRAAGSTGSSYRKGWRLEMAAAPCPRRLHAPSTFAVSAGSSLRLVPCGMTGFMPSRTAPPRRAPFPSATRLPAPSAHQHAGGNQPRAQQPERLGSCEGA